MAPKCLKLVATEEEFQAYLDKLHAFVLKHKGGFSFDVLLAYFSGQKASDVAPDSHLDAICTLGASGAFLCNALGEARGLVQLAGFVQQCKSSDITEMLKRSTCSLEEEILDIDYPIWAEAKRIRTRQDLENFLEMNIPPEVLECKQWSLKWYWAKTKGSPPYNSRINIAFVYERHDSDNVRRLTISCYKNAYVRSNLDEVANKLSVPLDSLRFYTNGIGLTMRRAKCQSFGVLRLGNNNEIDVVRVKEGAALGRLKDLETDRDVVEYFDAFREIVKKNGPTISFDTLRDLFKGKNEDVAEGTFLDIFFCVAARDALDDDEPAIAKGFLRIAAFIQQCMVSGPDSVLATNLHESECQLWLDAQDFVGDERSFISSVLPPLPDISWDLLVFIRSLKKVAVEEPRPPPTWPWKFDLCLQFESQTEAVCLYRKQAVRGFLKKHFESKGVSINSLRFSINHRPLYLTTIGRHATFQDAERANLLDKGCVITCTRVDTPDSSSCSTPVSSNVKSQKKNKKKKSAKTKQGKRQNRRKAIPTYQAPRDTEDNLRIAHSRRLSAIFEEAADLFKGIRNKLNSLSLVSSSPKLRRTGIKVDSDTPLCTATEFTDVGTGGKAGQVSYVVRIGEPTSLFKSSKPNQKHLSTMRSSQSVSTVIDLHGCTKEEGRAKLDECLPEWMRLAMEGTFPWVITVRIVCGGGQQVITRM